MKAKRKTKSTTRRTNGKAPALRNRKPKRNDNASTKRHDNQKAYGPRHK